MEYPEVLKLYKYRAYNEKSLSMLINKKIWVSKPTAFNDPFDCKYDFDQNFTRDEYNNFLLSAAGEYGVPIASLSQEIANAYENGKLKQEGMDRLKKNVENTRKLISDSGVYTLSKTNSNILLWSHYADSHKGFCVEFSRYAENFLGDIEVTKPVQYEEHFPLIKITDLVDNQESIINAINTKSRKWIYEEEWRLFYQNGNVEEDLPAPISAIIFGLRMPENHETTIRNILKDDQHIIFKRVKIVEEKYEFEIVDA
jgi:hypothetical protein